MARNWIQTVASKLKTKDGFHDLPVQVAVLFDIAGDYMSAEPFCIKNITEENVTLNVRLYGMDTFIETVFFPGWNVENVCEVKGAPAGVVQGGTM